MQKFFQHVCGYGFGLIILVQVFWETPAAGKNLLLMGVVPWRQEFDIKTAEGIHMRIQTSLNEPVSLSLVRLESKALRAPAADTKNPLGHQDRNSLAIAQKRPVQEVEATLLPVYSLEAP